MADLKSLYENIGFEEVTTYIQSGNVIFESKKIKKTDLKSTIEKVIEKKYKFHVPVEIRTSKELKTIIENCPYEEAMIEDNGTKILVTFLQTLPSTKKIKILTEYVKAPEKLTVQGREVYLYCPNGYGRSKLTTTFLENKLAVSATTRNWKTVRKLHELSI